MFKIKRNDTVKVIAGRDKGKSGKVLKLFPNEARAIVEGINFVKRHAKKRRQEEQGGIVTMEAPITLSNLAVICPRCNKPTRVGATILSDKTKSRYCKKCEEVF